MENKKEKEKRRDKKKSKEESTKYKKPTITLHGSLRMMTQLE